MSFRANAVRPQLHALACNLANFLRTLALPGEVERWSLTTLREKVVKINAKVVAHGRYVVFQMGGWQCRKYSSGVSSTGSRRCDYHTRPYVVTRRHPQIAISEADVRLLGAQPPPCACRMGLGMFVWASPEGRTGSD